MTETDLYLPLKRAFETQGYSVFGEVKSCDLVAQRGDELVIVEMKCAFTLELVFQAIERQRATNSVYMAIPAPTRYDRKRWRGMLRLCRRLGVGLIVLRFTTKGRGVKKGVPEVVLDPAPPKPRIDGKRRKLILNEIQNRSGDFNTGGSTGRKIITAYREEALRIAQHLKLNGPSRVCVLARGAASRKAGHILLDNHYGWFERVSRGTYALTQAGEGALITYKAVLRPAARGAKAPAVNAISATPPPAAPAAQPAVKAS